VPAAHKHSPIRCERVLNQSEVRHYTLLRSPMYQVHRGYDGLEQFDSDNLVAHVPSGIGRLDFARSREYQPPRLDRKSVV